MKCGKETWGHPAALVTILIWGTTFIFTKVLLEDFRPVEILVLRFVIGFAALLLICPRRLHTANKKEELTLAAAGLCGVTLYYLLENIALTYTLASNVGVIISVAPFFTAIISWCVDRKAQPSPRFFAGFGVAMAGICLISFNGKRLHLDPLGDLLALGAALVWACYGVLTRRVSSFGYPTVLTTRRTFGYGLLFMLPVLPWLGFHPEPEALVELDNLMGLLFLGLGASALCFVTWNFAVRMLGAVRTSIYIYLVPVITVVASAIVLKENITPMAACGTVLTLIGLALSQDHTNEKKKG